MWKIKIQGLSEKKTTHRKRFYVHQNQEIYLCKLCLQSYIINLNILSWLSIKNIPKAADNAKSK